MFERRLKRKLADKAMRLHKNDRAYKTADYIDFAITVIMVITAVFAFRAFIFEPVQVSGDSMNDTLHDGERMFVEKFTYWFDNPSRGDIIICRYPESYRATHPSAKPTDTYVKRVIALPGETIRIDEEGKVYIKGTQDGAEFELLNEDYCYFNNASEARRGYYTAYPLFDTVVPDDAVFVMGDNRNSSADSRQSTVGPIKIKDIIGRVHGVVYPISQIRDLGDVNYA